MCVCVSGTQTPFLIDSGDFNDKLHSHLFMINTLLSVTKKHFFKIS